MRCGEEEKEEDRDGIIDIISPFRPKPTRGEGNFIMISNVPNAREYCFGVSHLPNRRRLFFSTISRTVDTNDLHAALPHRN